eukprot:g1098.t1
MASASSSNSLLVWYDRHARTLPWRVSPADRKLGEVPDPYRVWLSEIMLQQTTVAAVKAYFEKFVLLWPTVEDLAAASEEEVMKAWAGLGYYSRARNLKKCAETVAANHGGRFPEDEGELLNLPGIGPYTAAAIATIAFDRHAAVVDGNVERVLSRLFRIETPLPEAKPDIKGKMAELTPLDRPGDFAQAVMDLGATICTPKKPACGLCPWREICEVQSSDLAETLPRKAPKKEKPTRYGAAFVAVDAETGAVLLRRRPPRGLLGGMTEVPGTDWSEGFDPDDALDHAPFSADWRKRAGEWESNMKLIQKLVFALLLVLPLSAAKAGSSKDIVDTAVGAGSFNTLVAAVQAAGLVDTLKGDGPFTVFAPTDEAFAKLPEGTVENLLKPENKDQLIAVLTYHVVPGKVMSSDIAGKKAEVASVQGGEISVDATDGVKVDNATVVTADVEASNGVIHYWLHYRLLADWGYARLAKKEREESIEEMQHADKLTDRIIFLEGHPNMQKVAPLRIGQNIKEVLESDLAGEYDARTAYSKSREVCREEGDYVSMAIFEELLKDEEGHIDFLETQLELLEKIGIERYGMLNAAPADEAE